MRHVRNGQQQGLLLFCSSRGYDIKLLDAVTHLTHALFQLLSLLAAAFLHHLPNQLGRTVTLLGERLLLRLSTAALHIALKHLIHKHPVITTTQTHSFLHIFGIFPDNTNI